MNLFSRLFKRTTAQQQAYLDRFVSAWDGTDVYSGNVMNVHAGLLQDAVWTAIKRIADAVAMTPVGVFQYTGDGNRTKARSHPVYNILNLAANQDSTSYTWKHVSTTHLMAWGNAFSEIERNGAGQIIALHPMHPADVKIEGRDAQGQLIYSWTNKSHQKFYFSSYDILHIKGVSFDGIVGVSPIWHLRQLVGRIASREEYMSRFYANGALLGGVITSPAGLTDDQMKRLRESFNSMYRGPKNSGKILLLEGASTFNQLGLHPKDADFINTAKLDSGKIAAAFGVPSQLLNETESVNRASAEQIFREFLSLGLNTIFSNIESQLNVSLFTPAEQASFYAEFNRESIVQLDYTAKIQGLKDQILTAMIQPNEARQMLNLPPVPGGDVLLAPVNMMPINSLGKTPAPTPVPSSDAPARAIRAEQVTALLPAKRTTGSNKARLSLMRSFKPALRDAFERIGTREKKDLQNAVKKNLRSADSFNSFTNDYYSKDSAFSGYFRKTLTPLLGSMSAATKDSVGHQLDTDIDTDGSDFQNSYLDNLLWRYTSSSQRQLSALLDDLGPDDDAADTISDRINQWQDGSTDQNPSRAEKESNNESNRYINAAARMFMSAAGVTKLVWTGGDCPLCQQMDGKTCGIEDNFLDAGDSVGDMTAESDYSNPPLHQGCECTVEPA